MVELTEAQFARIAPHLPTDTRDHLVCAGEHKHWAPKLDERSSADGVLERRSPTKFPSYMPCACTLRVRYSASKLDVALLLGPAAMQRTRDLLPSVCLPQRANASSLTAVGRSLLSRIEGRRRTPCLSCPRRLKWTRTGSTWTFASF